MEVSVSFLGSNDYPKTINLLNDSTCDYIHYDVMDGKFVNNKNLSVSELKKTCGLSNKKIDVHLMVSDPDKYIEALLLYNISYITIHSEIDNYKDYIDKIKSYGFRVGLAISPETSVNYIKDDLSNVDMVLVMGVNPGASGQKFIPEVAEKIKELVNLRKEKGYRYKISVDGGINEEVLHYVSDADIIVSASFVLNNLENIELIKQFKE